MRGGRGRGRGRGGRGGLTQDLLRDNLEDLGFDRFHHSNDNNPPPLYPPIALHPPLTITQLDHNNIIKMREITKRFQASPYYLIDKKQENDIIRYSDRYRTNGLKVNILDYVTYPGVDSAKYIPSDLLNTSSKKLDKKRKLTESDILQQLEQQEKSGGGRVNSTNEEEKEESDAEEEEEVDELELEDDYGVDHYASDDGGGSDDDGEAVF